MGGRDVADPSLLPRFPLAPANLPALFLPRAAEVALRRGSAVENRAVNQPLPSQLRRREHSLRSESARTVGGGFLYERCTTERPAREREKSGERVGGPARSLNAAVARVPK